MVWILLFFCAGILLGTRVGHMRKFMRSIGWMSDFLIILLLFLLGAAIGSNAQIMDHLWGLGWAGLLLAGGSIAGSILLAKPVERLLPGDDRER